MRCWNHLSGCVLLVLLFIGVSAMAGCQSGQSPIVPTQKNPVIHIHGDNNTVNLKWKTDIWLEGNQNKQDQENKADVKFPLLGP